MYEHLIFKETTLIYSFFFKQKAHLVSYKVSFLLFLCITLYFVSILIYRSIYDFEKTND